MLCSGGRAKIAKSRARAHFGLRSMASLCCRWEDGNLGWCDVCDVCYVGWCVGLSKGRLRSPHPSVNPSVNYHVSVNTSTEDSNWSSIFVAHGSHPQLNHTVFKTVFYPRSRPHSAQSSPMLHASQRKAPHKAPHSAPSTHSNSRRIFTMLSRSIMVNAARAHRARLPRERNPGPVAAAWHGGRRAGLGRGESHGT